jgi:cell division protein FtsB
MRLLLIALLVLLVLVQVRLWTEVSEVRGLRVMVEEQNEENQRLRERNDALAAEVEDLRAGLEAIEERARAELGLIRDGETFYLIVDPEQIERDPDD